ncbi:CotH kinase family protein, partial [Acinetobacter baumannii]
VYPKKNFSFGFFTDESFTTERSIKLGDLIPQQELVWKANWIDATHSRNILCNRLWEEMVQSRKGFPKREVDRAYLNQLGVNSLDTGAVGHVDGYPAVVRLNGVFYGIGTLNIGKKRDNYNLDKSNKKHV